jgi:Zinc carboxypeptidase
MGTRDLPELEELERFLEQHAARFEVRTLCEVDAPGRRFPVYALTLGNPSREAPAAGFFGGVHGLERVGTQVLLSFLASLASRLDWDERIQRLASELRLVFMPLVNPAGMHGKTRANANGVDLMRNAPLEARERVAFLVGGQRLTPRLPWYRGKTMENESEALCRLAREELLSRPFSIALDCHSGFGLRDRIWFPYAHTRDPFARLAEVHALVALYTEAHPSHPYLFEPQSRRYRAHGDLWDYLCAEAASRGPVFLPLTLEMGSWRWIRKSPRQLWSRIGLFNPLPAERLQRVRRNHLSWLYFLCQAAAAYRDWLPTGAERLRHEQRGLATWFGRPA